MNLISKYELCNKGNSLLLYILTEENWYDIITQYYDYIQMHHLFTEFP